MRRNGLPVLMAAAAMLLAGCLMKDLSNTWYVDADGAVSWVVLEKEVRSNATEPAEREQEERKFWSDVEHQEHAAARGMRNLGATDVRTTVLRSRVPYSVQTEAQFAGLDAPGTRLLAALKATGSSEVTHLDGLWVWTFTVSPSDHKAETLEELEVLQLEASVFKALRVALASGHFERARGFTLSSDNRIASLDPSVMEQDEGTSVTFQLAWRTEP